MSSSKQGFYSRVTLSPRVFRHFMNLWPPFWGMRIHIEHISDDWKSLRIRMKLGLRNKNYVGAHFGGGLFAMVDPFYMIMHMHLLGPDYLVWDRSGKIEFLTPGRATVYAHFVVTNDMINAAKIQTTNGEKFEPTYRINIVDEKGAIVAHVDKTLYIRKKRV